MAMTSTMADRQGAAPPNWLGRSRLDLLRVVIGGFAQNRDKAVQLVELLAAYVWPPVIQKRLQRLRELGHCDAHVTVAQLLVAARDQMLLSAFAETKEFYQAQKIPWGFHNLRRFISGPATVMDATGLHSGKQTLIHHVLQTFHRHPIYDLVLLRAHPNGVAELQQQIDELAAGTHSHGEALLSLIEDGSYHARLRDDVAEFAAAPHVTPRPPPRGLLDDPNLMLAMDQFKDIRGYTNYASRLPVGSLDAVTAWFAVVWDDLIGARLGLRLMPKHIVVEACDQELITRYFGDDHSVHATNKTR